MITQPDHVYELARRLIALCQEHGYNEIAQRLDDALHVGSSSLEMLGAIRAVLLDARTVLERVEDGNSLDAAINYVDQAFGRR